MVPVPPTTALIRFDRASITLASPLTDVPPTDFAEIACKLVTRPSTLVAAADAARIWVSSVADVEANNETNSAEMETARALTVFACPSALVAAAEAVYTNTLIS